MKLLNVFKRRDLWQIGIYKIPDLADIFNLDSYEPLCMFGENGVRLGFSYQSTVADPFLFSHNNCMYLFYEVKTDHDHGEIWAAILSPAGSWTSVGCVLRESFHLSYPQVFESEGKIYMIPEAAQSGKVLLYQALDFPKQWLITSVIANEGLSDPTIHQAKDGNYYLFGTTRKNELKLLHSSSLGKLFDDTKIIITNDKLLSRCAGGIVTINGVNYRPAQDCLYSYGKSVRMYSIDKLSVNDYSETLVNSGIFRIAPTWAAEGYHQISVASFGAWSYVAVDGRSKDNYISTLTYGALKIFEKIRSVFR